MDNEVVIEGAMRFLSPREILSIASVSKLFHRVSKYDSIWKDLVKAHFPESTIRLGTYQDIYKEEYRRYRLMNRCSDMGIVGFTDASYRYICNMDIHTVDNILDHITKGKVITLYDIDQVHHLSAYDIEYLIDETVLDMASNTPNEQYIVSLIHKYPMKVHIIGEDTYMHDNYDLLYAIRALFIENELDVSPIDQIDHDMIH